MIAISPPVFSLPTRVPVRRAAFLLTLLAASGLVLAIDGVSLHLDRLSFQGWVLTGSDLTVSLSDGPDPLFTFRSTRVEHPASGTVIHDLRAVCAEGTFSGEALSCTRGRLEMRHEGLGNIRSGMTIQMRDRFREVALRIEDLKVWAGLIQIQAAFRGDEWTLALDAADIDPGALYRLLDANGDGVGGLSLAGRVRTGIKAAGRGDELVRVDWSLAAKGLSFDTAAGEYAGEGLNGTWQGALESAGDAGWRGHQAVALDAGLLLTPFFLLEPGGKKIALSADLEADKRFARVRLVRVDYDHPGVLKIGAELQLGGEGSLAVERLRLRTSEVSMGTFYGAYIKPVLGRPLLRDLQLDGIVSVDELVYSAGTLSVDATVKDGMARLPGEGAAGGEERLFLSSVAGDLHWSTGGATTTSSLTIGEGRIFSGITLGRTELALDLGGGGFALSSPATIPILDGTLEIAEFSVAFDEQEPTVAFDGFLTPLSLSKFSTAVGLPPFSGQLSGMIPAVRYRGGSLQVDGAILVRVFDGSILVERLRLEGLLGVFPVMEADLKLQSLDLKMVTDAFSFGKITGRLEGRVDDLRLEQWRPVRFDASLRTPDGDNSPHWISQRAVDNISNLGGAGIQGAVSRGFLRFFEEFRYDRLGVSCRLAKGVCEMDGIEPADQGYYLVKGGGLPRIDIKGFNRRTDWDVLTDKLKQIAEGESPRIE